MRQFLTFVLELGREAWALLVIALAGGVGLGLWWGVREGENALKAGQAPTIAQLKYSLERLTDWFRVLEEASTTQGLELANVITLCRREMVALEHYIRDLEAAPRPGTELPEHVKQRRALELESPRSKRRPKL